MSHDRKALTYVEVDVDWCELTYGVAPCTAALGVTGNIKCFNTRKTCQDIANFSPVTVLAIPQVLSITPSTFASGSPKAVAMPAVVDAGDLLLVLWSSDDPAATVTIPGDFTSLKNESYPTSTQGKIGIAAKIAAGNEGGTTKNFTHSTTEEFAAQVYRIAAGTWRGTLTTSGIAVSSLAQSATTSAFGNPPSLSPTWGTAHNLWIAFLASNSAASISVYPTDFTGGIHTVVNAGANIGAAVSSATLIRNAATVDPSSFSLPALRPVGSYTIAIRPVGAPGGVIRFGLDADYLPKEVECFPVIRQASVTPPVLSLGENLGQRAKVSVKLRDFKHSDTGPSLDKYHAERPYDPFKLGTFFGKFRARYPFMQGKRLRLIRGLLPDSAITSVRHGVPMPSDILDEQETRHYIIESFDGPRPDGEYELFAVDVLKLSSGDRSQVPRLSGGRLSANINNSTTSISLLPSGIGNAEYSRGSPAANYYAAIGGQEIVLVTAQSSDSLTVTRGQLGTTAVAHNAAARVQRVIRYEVTDVADIIYDLLVTHAGVPAEYIPLDDWQAETASFLNQVYTGTIAEPTSVETILSELIQQAALVLWWSDTEQHIKLQVLRPIAPNAAAISEDDILVGTLQSKEQPNTRLSRVWTYFGKRNPLEPQDDPSNYTASAEIIETDAEDEYGSVATKKVFSRWIAQSGRAIAEQLNQKLLGRFRDPPREFSFDLLRYDREINLGGGYQLRAWPLQDATGAPDTVPIQVTELSPGPDVLSVTAQEALFSDIEGGGEGNVVVFDVSQNNVNLRTVHDLLYTPVTGGQSPPEVVSVIINSGITIGSTSTTLPAFDVGTWPAGVEINIVNSGRIQGRGGGGGDGGNQNQAGKSGAAGGTALWTRYAVNINSTGGEIFGGGGGGSGGGGASTRGGGGGGGGSGTNGGSGGDNGQGTQGNGSDGKNGTRDAGGDGGGGSGAAGDGGRGGHPGQAGQDGGGTSGSPGAAGRAIDGISFVSLTGGDIRGPTAN